MCIVTIIRLISCEDFVVHPAVPLIRIFKVLNSLTPTHFNNAVIENDTSQVVLNDKSSYAWNSAIHCLTGSCLSRAILNQTFNRLSAFVFGCADLHGNLSIINLDFWDDTTSCNLNEWPNFIVIPFFEGVG